MPQVYARLSRQDPLRPDETGIRPHPLRDGVHNHDLGFQDQPSQLGPWPHSSGLRPPATWLARRPMTQGRLPIPSLLPWWDDDEGHDKFTSHRTVGEPPPCQQCPHDRQCSIMPWHATTWAQDHEDNHTQMCADAKTRWPSMKAKFTSFPSLRLTTTLFGGPLSVCNLALRLYIKVARRPLQGDVLSRLHLGSPSPLSYLFPSTYTPHSKNLRAFNQGTHTRPLSETGRRALAWTKIIPCVFGCYHYLPRAARHTYKFTRWLTKHR
jgi:hypothetical protein